MGVLYEKYDVKEPQDLYTKLNEDMLSKVEMSGRVVGTQAKTIMVELVKSKQCPINELFGSVCIKFLGRRQVEIIMKESKGSIRTVDDIFNMTKDDLLSLPGFKDSKASGIIDGIKKAKGTIEALIVAGVVPIVSEEAPKGSMILDMDDAPVNTGKLSGKAFCFTGGINKVDAEGKRYTRERMWQVVKDNGGTVMEEVHKLGDHECFLVQASPDSISSKSKKAVKLSIQILSEADFWKMVE